MNMLRSFYDLVDLRRTWLADEDNRVSRFQQGLKLRIQMFLIPQQLKMYSQVLTITREVKWGLEKKNQDKMQKKLVKRPSQLMDGEDSVRLINVPLTIRSFQPSLPQSVRNFVHRPGHYKHDYRMVNVLCLACGTEGHLIRDCPFKKIRNIIPIRPTLPAALVKRTQDPLAGELLFFPSDIPPIRHRENQGLEQVEERGKRIIWQKKGAQISDRVRTGGDAKYPKPEPWRCHP